MSVQLMKNISNSFLALLWRLETSSKIFYGFETMAIWCDLLTFIYEVYYFEHLNTHLHE